ELAERTRVHRPGAHLVDLGHVVPGDVDGLGLIEEVTHRAELSFEVSSPAEELAARASGAAMVLARVERDRLARPRGLPRAVHAELRARREIARLTAGRPELGVHALVRVAAKI